MKKNLTLATLITCLILSGFNSFGQLVGDCAYLKGRFLELGLAPTGAFGAPRPAPAGYHPGAGGWLYDPGTGTTYTSGQIGFIADPNMDGWTTGTPAKFGDFFIPGSPQEGWSVQVAGAQSNAWLQNLGFAGTGYTGSLYGTTTSYSSTGSVLRSVWTGGTSTPATSPLQIVQTTTFDTMKLYFTVNVKLKNTGTAPANNVYYLRTVDPDNEEEQTFNFNTINNIAFQLPNPTNKVLVTARGVTYAAAFLGLGTKDCRAKCFVIDAGLTPYNNLAACYNQTTTYHYNVGYTGTNDVGIGLVYNIGTIAAGDSADLTYAYIMRNADLDSALNATSPTVVAGSTLLLPGSDTINACTSTTDSININVANGASYTWTWAPATGLTSTTGTSSTLVLSTVPAVTTYTLIGVPLSGSLCGNDTFHFTVMPGISAGPGVVNLTYCQFVTAPALTATGVNLLWYTTATGGTGSVTAPTPSTLVPGVYTWWVSQHIGICGESVRVPITVTVNAAPSVTNSSNSPVCQYNTLYLFATDTITTGTPTFVWSGPGGFTSTMRNPSISNVPLSASGIYTVTLTLNGCTATDTTVVVIKTTPIISSITQTNPSACNVSDGTFTLYGLTADSAYTVYYMFNGTTPFSVPTTANSIGQITITGLHAGIYSNIYVIGTNGCPSNIVSATLPDGAAPPAPVLSSNGPVCSDSTLRLFATASISPVTFNWVGPNSFTSTLQNPVRTGVPASATGTYSCTITNTITGCTSLAGTLFVTVNPTPTVPVVSSNSAVCEGTTLTLSATSIPSGASFSWNGPASFTSGSTSPTIFPAALTNAGVYTVVATLNGCPSMPGYFTAVVNPIPPAPVPNDVSYCQFDIASPLTASGAGLLWYTTATGGTGTTAAPTPSTAISGVVTYYVSQTLLGCESPRAPLYVTTKLKPVVEIATTNGALCQTDTMVYTSTGPAYPGATYLWQMPVGATITSGSDSVQGPIYVRFDSTYLRTVMLTVSYNGCSTTAQNDIYVVPTPTIDLYLNPNVCVGDTVTVALATTTYHPNITSYTWNFGGGTVITAASGGGGPYSIAWYTPGVYVVHVTGYTEQSACPSQSMYDTVRVHAAPVATFTGGGVACNGDTVVLTATVSDPSYTYTWAPAPFFTGLGAVNAPVATANVMFPGYISLTVTDPFGCSSIDSMLFNPAPCCLITFPTAFTPNGDGSNDYFRPITAGHHTLSLFRVVNRWGATVFETTTTDTYGWDGTYGGVPQDMDTYYYVLRYTCNGTTMEESGDVTLIR